MFRIWDLVCVVSAMTGVGPTPKPESGVASS